MKYFKIFDDLAPEGQLYRLNDDKTVLECMDDGGSVWVESAWTAMFGPLGVTMFFSMAENDQARFEDVEV